MVAVVRDDGNTVRAEVDFVTGDRSVLPIPWSICEGTDSVRINGVDAEERDRGERIEYGISWSADTAPRTYRFELERADASVEASVALPSPFEIVSPEALATLPRDVDTILQWQPLNESAVLQIELEEDIGGGICLTAPGPGHTYKARRGVEVEDDGEWTVPAGSVQSSGDGPCAARFRLSRFSFGDYPVELATGGFIEGGVSREVSFTSIRSATLDARNAGLASTVPVLQSPR